MSELIYCENGQLGHAAGSAVSGGTFTLVSAASLKVKTEGFGVYRGPLSFTFAGGNASGFVPGSVTGVGVINPTSAKVRAETLFVLREGDSVTVAFTGTPTGGGPAAPVPGVNQVEVASAGQTTARAE